MIYKGIINKWISIIHRKFQVYINHELEGTGINASEFLYILHLSKNEIVSQRYLTEHLYMDDAQTTRVIRSLEHKGLVMKNRNELDKREFEISLTEEGRKLVPIIRKALLKWKEILTEGEDPESLKTLEKNLNAMAMRAVDAVDNR